MHTQIKLHTHLPRVTYRLRSNEKERLTPPPFLVSKESERRTMPALGGGA